MSVPAKIAATAAVAALVAMTLHACEEAKADTVITGEGIFMPRGNTARHFGGVFCEQGCTMIGSVPTSLSVEARRLDEAVMASSGPVTVLTHSHSSAAIALTMADWAADPATAPDPARVRVITTGSPYSRYGGTQRNQAGAVPIPVGPYAHLDVVMQYDSVADKPARFGWYSSREVSFSRHMAYPEADINAPENLVRSEGNSTYMLIPAKDLKQLSGMRFLRDIGWVSEERYAAEDARRRELIERDYDRPDDLLAQGDGADWTGSRSPEVHSLMAESGDDAEDDGEVAERDAVDVDLGVGGSEDGDNVAPDDARRGAGGDQADGDADAAGDGDAGDDSAAGESGSDPA